MPGFQELIDFIANGELVQANVANRAPRALDGNIRYLRDVLAASIKGDAVIAFAQTINSNVLEGQAVYFDSTSLQYEQGIAQTEVDVLTGSLVTSQSAQIWGVVMRKVNATKADILIGGVGEIDLTNAVIGDVELGKLYFLSGTVAGKMTSSRPPVGVPVMTVGQQGVDPDKYLVYVNPQFTDFLRDHTHVKFDLQAVPAGTHEPPVEGAAHVITDADSSVEGWLPADDEVFAGNAPTGAKFGYNIAASSLANVWPPVPARSASLEIHRQSVYDAAPNPKFPAYGRVPDSVVVINEDGIWWMTDCYDAVPWPTNYDNTNPISVSASVGDCPVDDAVEDVLLTLWYTNIRFFTSNSAVLSIKGRTGSGISVYCRNTDVLKQTGHLEIDLDLAVLVNGGDQAGHLVFKEYDSETRQFKRGPVAESIRSASPEVVITSDVETVGENGERYGNILITANLDLDGSNLPVETVRLDGVEEEFYEDVLGLGFPVGRASEFRGRIKIPTRITLPSGTQMKLRFWVMGRIAGTLGAALLPLTYRRVLRPGAVLTTPVALPTTDTALAMNTAATFTAADQYVEMESAAFDVTTGDEILFTIGRAASDGYGDKLILLRQEGVLVASS